jgi:hypothetical protein
MPYTSDDLAKRALGILKAREAGQEPSPEDMAGIKEFIPPLLEQLGISGAGYVGDEDDIPGYLFLPLAKRLALEAASEWGLEAVGVESIQEIETVLRALTASKASSAPVKVRYF